MKQSVLFGTTRRDISKDETSKNAIVLQKAGFVVKTMAGVYAYLPLGLRVLQNISTIVREEMDKLPHTQEVLMAALQPKELWDESGRWVDYVDDMYRVPEAGGGLGPTHEEVVTDIFRQYVSSYKDMPLAVYQIQNKFRKEARAKSGLLRGREFLMKDLYSFHTTEADLLRFYDEVRAAYCKVYERCGLTAIYTQASGGLFSKFSHEFQVMSEVGEDTIYLNSDNALARNKEIVSSESDEELLAFSGGTIKKASSIEVGNIFPLSRKFSTPMHAQVSLEDGEKTDVWMGSYGIGISRLMGTIVEVLAESEAKMVWPKEVSPFEYHLIDLTTDGGAASIYESLQAAGKSVLYDDRDKRAGEKFADADLIGIPTRLIVSKRSLEAGGIERKSMTTGESEIVTIEQL